MILITIIIKRSNLCPIHSRVPDRVFRPLHGLTCEPFPCYMGGRRRWPVSTATRSRNRMLADGEEIHYPCTTSLGVPSPRGLGVSIDSVDSTSIPTSSSWAQTCSRAKRGAVDVYERLHLRRRERILRK